MNTFQKQIVKSSNLCSAVHKTHKTKLLNILLEQNQDLAPQGSEEWLAMREFNIGGSEMSVMTGENPYSSIDDLVAQKIGMTKFEGNIATRWGKLFEPITQMITEKILNVVDKIKETGSLEGAVSNQRYSPDGLALLKILCAETICGEYIETEEYCIVLFEYKSPYSSIPKGIIPKHYLPQVKTGLCSIPLADFAIFINNLFRKCAYHDLDDTPVYDTTFHKNDTRSKFNSTEPLALGMILFYQTEDQQKQFYEAYAHMLEDQPVVEFDYSSDTDEDVDTPATAEEVFNGIFPETNTKKYNLCAGDPNIEDYKYIYKFHSETNIIIRDIGQAYYHRFGLFLKLYDDNLLSAYYCEPHIFKRYEQNTFLAAQETAIPDTNLLDTKDKYHAILNNRVVPTALAPNIIGYLPWKLFKSDIIYEPREDNYVQKHEHTIQETINIIKNIKACENDQDKIEEFKKWFPKSKIPDKLGMNSAYNREFLPQ
jgi:hypothetical protein